MSAVCELRIIKLGGSLLDLADLTTALRNWLARQTPASNIVLVGGGRTADTIREYDRLHGLSDSDAHWLAIRAMELNGRLLASLLPEAVWLETLGRNTDADPAPLGILDPYRFLRDDQHAPGALQAGWQVTSDSIAARLAVRSGAEELVLLKSALPPAASTIQAAAAAGYVDPMFFDTSRAIPCIRCVSLRDPTFAEVVWCGGKSIDARD